MQPIYLDYNATTPIDPEVAEAMRPYLYEHFGNPSSSHWYGQQTRQAVEKARQQVAQLLHCHPDEIIFTSGGSEANNYAIKGVAFANRTRGNHIITSAIEHPAVIEVCKYLETKDFEVTYVPVETNGLVTLEAVEQAIRPQTILITIMHANNEVGTIQPIADIARLARQHSILVHTDAAQSVGKIPTTIDALGVDLLSIAGHKLYAPKGIGVLYKRRGLPLEKLMHGADHERGLRAGTENVLEIVGLGQACAVAQRDLTHNMAHMRQMRDRLEAGLTQRVQHVRGNGHRERRLPNTLSVSFAHLEANRLLAAIEGVAASSGAACHADTVDVSAVLTAMHVPLAYAMGTLRFSVGKMTTQADIDGALDLVVQAVHRLRQASNAVLA
ncbi:MAG TPA: aminotransferase class V-fold PLP-dependent enzyme [Candidatus Tectomicrobia bacterium]|jgi:cysteine desulfurase NifS